MKRLFADMNQAFSKDEQKKTWPFIKNTLLRTLQ
jgi:hypothetical protein